MTLSIWYHWLIDIHPVVSMQQNTPRTYDFIVIGGGIAGASIACELASSKTGSVVKGALLEREQAFGYHTTGRSAATSVELMHEQTIFTLTRNSRRFLNEPPAGFTESPLLKPCGCFITGTAADQTRLEAVCEQAQALGVDATLVSSSEIARHIPVIRESPENVYAGIYERHAQRVDVDALLQGYVKGAKAHGCEFFGQIEISAITRQDNLWQVVTGPAPSRQIFQTPLIINAAGAWADEIAQLAGIEPIGLEPKRRTIITFNAPAQFEVTNWPMIADIGGTFYFMPEGRQLMGSPADATPSPPCDAQPEEIDIATAVYNIQQHTTLEIDRINHKWAGLRTFAADDLPVVGFEPKAEGFFWYAGQSGFGIQVAPALATMGAALASGDDDKIQTTATSLDLDLGHILPERLR